MPRVFLSIDIDWHVADFRVISEWAGVHKRRVRFDLPRLIQRWQRLIHGPWERQGLIVVLRNGVRLNHHRLALNNLPRNNLPRNGLAEQRLPDKHSPIDRTIWNGCTINLADVSGGGIHGGTVSGGGIHGCTGRGIVISWCCIRRGAIRWCSSVCPSHAVRSSNPIA